MNKKSVTILIIIFLISFKNSYCQESTIEKIGDVTQLAVPISAGLTSLIIKDKKGTYQFIKSYATTIAITYALKYTINKKRPNGGNYAFPSGHTSSAFAGAAFIQKRYGWKYGIPAYALATFTGYSRVYAKKHDYWDILGGAIVGIGSAYLFTNKYKTKKDVSITFSSNENTYSLGLKYKF